MAYLVAFIAAILMWGVQVLTILGAFCLLLLAIGCLDAVGRKWADIVDQYNRPMRSG